MEDFWKGAITGDLRKHRDYLHNTWFEHELANGGSYSVDTDSVMTKYDPVTESPLLPTKLYSFVDFIMHTGEEYPFLVPNESDESLPEEKRIKDTINDYVTNPIEGGRDWFDYVDLDDPKTLNNLRVQERLARGDIANNPKLRRDSPYYSFWDEMTEGQ